MTPPNRNPWSAEDTARFLEMREANIPVAIISVELNRSMAALDSKRRELKLSIRRQGGVLPPPTPELVDRVREALATMGQVKAARFVGISLHQLYSIADKYELRPEPTPQQQSQADRMQYGSDPLPPMHPISWGAIQSC